VILVVGLDLMFVGLFAAGVVVGYCIRALRSRRKRRRRIRLPPQVTLAPMKPMESQE
jgi:hypothetical protein